MSGRDLDVLVAGAGPVGLFAALTAARSGAKVALFDEEWRETARSYALALHPGTLRLFADAGLAEPLAARGHRVDRIVFYAGTERIREVRLDTLPGPYPFVLVLPQHDLEQLLAQRLAEHAVPVSWNQRVAGLLPAGDAVSVEIERLEKTSSGYAVATTEWVVDKVVRERARFVIGADGHRSGVRRALGFDWREVGDPELYAVFEFDAESGPEHEVRVVLGAQGKSVLWPMPGGRWRWSFQLPDSARVKAWREKSRLAVQLGRQAFEQLGEEQLLELIAERAPWFEARPSNLRWSTLVRFERRLSSGFGQGRSWLCGDAAHLAGPIGVQSMNVGLREGHDLVQRLGRALAGDAGPELLEAYQRERLAEWSALLATETSTEDWPVGGYSRTALRACLPASGADLERLAEQL
jgi:NADPH-dependent dioxygenase